ncbi:FkbM family methyltransferase [Roseivirga pacifica]|uniref:FkbM family methyltransferase n=1 Tax=Roseivirga pacifica TaxID=1267423 RepID=UPI00209478B1|nr:FkbM family methyltransferase [Roseivirga pacifica]MCO6357679.1 FkbM family methyltransferase [Roseivirga pacifica]MCO6365932.1 FkbM family methyltransferase [Roseivirga pacifica]MCO6371260.1 FkbM family methyltransferase [Roseivirga pacifica]MCO6375569.1 FkbM family methyltransferase [Roseivirga pacifica]MCO6378638.1 FkbM family methyltransferase [Roseivirga pacifica]
MSKKFSKLRFLYRAYKYRYIEDSAELKYIEDNITPGQLVLDIGTHKGGYLYWIQKATGKNGQVVAFEPQPILYDYVKEAIDVFGYKNVEFYHGGLSSQQGALDLFIPKAKGLTSPGATFEKREGRKGHFIKVPIYQLDELLAERRQPVSFIKMDVEGHELEVFKGADNILKKDRPKLIFECENRHLNNRSVKDVFEYVQGLGYRGFFFKNGKKLPINSFNSAEDQLVDGNLQIVNKKGYCNNFVFEPTA